jgi:transcriptional regulator with XRE-family HTH domain
MNLTEVTMMFAEKLKTLRKQKGLTQTKFAKDFNIATGTIGMWETGKRQPDYNTLVKIAKYFDVSINYLLEEQAEPEELQIARSRTRELHETNSVPTIQTIEEKTGTSYTTFRQWYEGTGDYFNDKLYLIADLYNVSIDYLLGRQEQLPELNNKDQKEIQKILDETKEQLLSQDGLMFDGVPATEEDVQKIIMAMQMGMEMIKKENKAKFTPKKYRKNN